VVETTGEDLRQAVLHRHEAIDVSGAVDLVEEITQAGLFDHLLLQLLDEKHLTCNLLPALVGGLWVEGLDG